MPAERRLRGQTALEEPLLTVRELAELLGLREQTVYDWVAKGRIPCVRLSRSLRFDRSAIREWLEARKEG